MTSLPSILVPETQDSRGWCSADHCRPGHPWGFAFFLLGFACLAGQGRGGGGNSGE